MAKIQDIINAATPGPWHWYAYNFTGARCLRVDRPDDSEVIVHSLSNGVHVEGHNADFIATFDPEHIALMEAVIERTWFATDSWETSYCCGHDLFDGHAESCPVEKLFKFRKEHGLDG